MNVIVLITLILSLPAHILPLLKLILLLLRRNIEIKIKYLFIFIYLIDLITKLKENLRKFDIKNNIQL